MLMNIKTLDWDKPTLQTLKLPASILPKIVSNSEVIGKIAKGWPITGIPIAGCLGDQHAAMVGQACRKGEAKSTYGTSAFILVNTGEEDARGVCIGITRFTNRSHIARAVLESMCFQVNDVLDSMHKDASQKDAQKGEFLLRVDGGATVYNLLMQIQVDFLGSPVVRPADIETTALGAAYAAGTTAREVGGDGGCGNGGATTRDGGATTRDRGAMARDGGATAREVGGDGGATAREVGGDGGAARTAARLGTEARLGMEAATAR
ncbi:Glycerol kinase [Linum perenne]